MVRMPGFEPGTAWSVARCSIQLSHIRTDAIVQNAILLELRPLKLTKTHGRVKESGGNGCTERVAKSQDSTGSDLNLE